MRTIRRHAAAAGEGHDVEAWLDGLDPEQIESRDSIHVRALIEANEALKEAAARSTAQAEELRRRVAAARKAGEPWAAIGAALGVSRQAAQQRFT